MPLEKELISERFPLSSKYHPDWIKGVLLEGRTHCG